jgi:signal transduction histidine kinase
MVSVEMRNLRLIGLLTWAIVGIPSLAWEIDRGTLFSGRALLWIVAYLAFAAMFWRRSRPVCKESEGWLWLSLQTVAWLICLACNPSGSLGVLGVIVAAQIRTQSFRVGLLWIAMQTILHAWILSWTNDSPIAVAFAYFSFQMFALFTSRVAHSEAEGRRKLAEAHAELQVASGIMAINSRTEERLRIARDLHDLLGHHLTALSLNLEVASHLASGPAREQIAKSQSITRLLLSDVRDVVSRLRDDEPIDLLSVARSFSDVVSSPHVQVGGAGEIWVGDPTVAQTALRTLQEIVTNAVRHSSAKNLRLAVTRDDHSIAIEGQDDGIGTDLVRDGNGLRGMRERAEALGGRVEVKTGRGEGFRVRVTLPDQVPA